MDSSKKFVATVYFPDEEELEAIRKGADLDKLPFSTFIRRAARERAKELSKKRRRAA